MNISIFKQQKNHLNSTAQAFQFTEQSELRFLLPEGPGGYIPNIPMIISSTG